MLAASSSLWCRGHRAPGRARVSIVEEWRKSVTDSRSILVATGTHAAKDVLQRRFKAKGILPSRRHRSADRPREAASEDPDVFVETVYMASEPDERTDARVLLDESSQMTIAAALVALTRGCEQLVLIGDPKQLGPVSSFGSHSKCPPEELQCLLPFARERRSIFEALQERQEEQHMLQVQYRMDPLLCQYPSQRFYDGNLLTADTVESRSFPGQLPEGFILKEGPPEHPVIFVDTSGQNFHEEIVRRAGSLSLQNPLEAQIVAALLQSLEVQPTSAVSVISAYGAQINLLAEVLHGKKVLELEQQRRRRSMMIRQHGLDPLEDEPYPRSFTVDGFQGNENDYIIFSAVRSNPTGLTGFLGQRQRLNVLLTRARYGLIVVGDASTLQSDEEWGLWLQSEKRVVTLTDEAAEFLRCRFKQHEIESINK
ncbi:unnamed protein product [Durusdinium trenchii]|uniref:RNA helicase n=1 Tax=Durusdinium trenchii TaxID=1381693 RepID=A0ABP0LM51_9DINO